MGTTRRAMASDTAGVPVPPPLIFVAGLAAGGLAELVRSTTGPSWPVSLTIGVVGIVAWAALDGYASLRFVRAGTPVIPFKPTTALVVDGPYRFSRNPIYLGMAALYVALTFLLGIMWALLFLPFVLVAVDRLIIAREEPYLERKFGQDYVEYTKRVRRWV
jgi:protein-S-isoprenylcysteine O-methyltransferase Ste14